MSKPGPESTEVQKEHPSMLMGRFDRTLDPKKRLTIPSVWRTALGPDYLYVLADAHSRSLQLIPKGTMEARLAKYEAAALGDKRVNAMLQKIASESEALEFDVQGRVRISDRLLAYAGIKGAVVLNGAVRMATIVPADGSVQQGAVDAEGLAAAMAELDF